MYGCGIAVGILNLYLFHMPPTLYEFTIKF